MLDAPGRAFMYNSVTLAEFRRLGDIKTIAPTGWYGSPEHATVDKGMKMLKDVADAIAKEASDIFRLLDEAQGGTAEIKHLKVAS